MTLTDNKAYDIAASRILDEDYRYKRAVQDAFKDRKEQDDGFIQPEEPSDQPQD